MKTTILVVLFALVGLSQEGGAPRPDLETQLKAANDRIAQLEERIKLMTLQQQGAIQFFQAGQALCELDKKQSQPTKPEKP